MPLISAKFLCDICVTLKALCMKRYKRTALCLKTRLYRQTDRQTDTETDKETDREIERERERDRDTEITCDEEQYHSFYFTGPRGKVGRGYGGEKK